MKREKSLLINSGLYFIGSLGKGAASVIVVFFGSFFLGPSEMGGYDLVISTISLLQPVIIFEINDGIYRWLLEDGVNSWDVIRCGYRIVFRNLAVAAAVMAILLPLLPVRHRLLIGLLTAVNCLYPVFQQITRGLKHHQIFARSGILNSILLLGLSVFLVAFTDLGAGAFYLAQLLAGAATVLYLLFSQKLFCSPWGGDSEAIRRISGPMQRYSLLMIPNYVNQWLMKTLDKYFILFYLGTWSNGIYTVAHRFPDMLVMINSMFYSAWVEQAIVEYGSADRDRYFSKVYLAYSRLLFSIVLLAIPLTRYVLSVFAGAEYFSAYRYVPFLYIGVIFLGLSGFVGTGYLGTKKTGGLMWTSVAGAIVNMVVNALLIPVLGLQAAGISSCCAYGVMWGLRIVQTRKFFRLEIRWKEFLALTAFAFLAAAGVQADIRWLDGLMLAAAAVLFLFLNRRLLSGLRK